MRKLLKDLAPGQNYAMQVRSVAADGTVSEWSQVLRFTTTGDSIAPAPVTGLTATLSGTAFIVKWTKPTLDAANKPLLDFKDYEVTVTSGGTSKVYYVPTESFEFTLAMNIEAFTTPATNVTFSVAARDLTLNESTVVSQTLNVAVPPIPSAPVVSPYLGQLVVTWDGNPATGTRNDFNLNHVEIHASTTSGFTPSTSTLNGRFSGAFPGQQQYMLNGFAYGTPVYVKLISVNHVGLKSAASAQATATPARISGLDIANGQISTAQINFTAKDIGGANAYYPVSNTARDALTGVKSGDIAYVTGDGYKTYRYNGTSWVAATEIGVISGTKILTGTLTADAVGTNLLITSAANIGTAVIDSASISSINAAKITTGTLQSSSTVTYGGGTARPTWQFDMNGDGYLNNVSVRGQLVIGSSTDPAAVQTASVVRSYDYLPGAAGWAIKGDGTTEFNVGTFRGNITGATITGSVYQTGATGRRVVMGSAGSTGEITFYPASGTQTSYIKSITESAGVEAVQLGLVSGQASDSPLWNRLNINSDEWTNLRSNKIDLNYLTGGSLIIRQLSSRNSSATATTRMQVDATQTLMWSPSNAVVYQLTNSSHTFYPANQSTSGWIRVKPNVNADSNFRSPSVEWATDNNGVTGAGAYTGILKYVMRTGGVNPSFAFRDGPDTVHIAIEAASFNQATSHRALKTAIEDLTVEAMPLVKKAKAHTYRMRDAQYPDQQIGLMIDELPDLVLGPENQAIDLYRLITLLWKAVQELDARIDKLETSMRAITKNK